MGRIPNLAESSGCRDVASALGARACRRSCSWLSSRRDRHNRHQGGNGPAGSGRRGGQRRGKVWGPAKEQAAADWGRSYPSFPGRGACG